MKEKNNQYFIIKENKILKVTLLKTKNNERIVIDENNNQYTISLKEQIFKKEEAAKKHLSFLEYRKLRKKEKKLRKEQKKDHFQKSTEFLYFVNSDLKIIPVAFFEESSKKVNIYIDKNGASYPAHHCKSLFNSIKDAESYIEQIRKKEEAYEREETAKRSLVIENQKEFINNFIENTQDTEFKNKILKKLKKVKDTNLYIDIAHIFNLIVSYNEEKEELEKVNKERQKYGFPLLKSLDFVKDTLCYKVTAMNILGVTRTQFTKLNLIPVKFVQNPHYKTGPLVGLYLRKDIEDLKETMQVKLMRAKRKYVDGV